MRQQTENWEVTETCEDATFFRKARKRHHCWGGHDGTKRTRCDQPIEPGSEYVEYLGETPAFQSGMRYHFICACQQGLVRARA